MATATQLRRDLAALTALAARDLSALWQQVSTAAQARQALEDVLPALVETYGLAAGAIAADWYDEAREKAGVGGRFRAFPIEVPDPGAAKLAGWAVSEGKTLDTTLSLAQGGTQRRIANVARGTIINSTAADPKAVGWMRVGAGACAFCRVLIGRGAVYTAATADFGAHDDCNCQAAPAFPGGLPIDVKKYRQSARNFRGGQKTATAEADYVRAREWIETNLPEGPAIPRF